jgi:adenylate kinase family enzyme
MNKIHIIGISGSGKSHLANILSNKLNIPKFDLDDIYYETKYSKIRDKIKRKEIISQIIKENNDWIIEGVYNS